MESPRSSTRTDEPKIELGRDDFCAYLRERREASGMPLDEIARVTRIPERSLEHLESGRFESLPGDVFVRGFVRSYARCVGLDAEDAIRRYAACGLEPAPVASEAAAAFFRRKSGPAGQRTETKERGSQRGRKAAVPAAREPVAATPTAPRPARVEAPASAPGGEDEAADTPVRASGDVVQKSGRQKSGQSASARRARASAATRRRRRRRRLAARRVAGGAPERARAKSPAAADEAAARETAQAAAREAEQAAAREADAREAEQAAAREADAREAEQAAAREAEAREAEQAAAREAEAREADAREAAAREAEQAAAREAAAREAEQAAAQAEDRAGGEIGRDADAHANRSRGQVAKPVAKPVLVIDDACPERAVRSRTDAPRTNKPEDTLRAFFLPVISEDEGSRRGALTLAVIILVIVATLTMSVLLRRPSTSSDGVTRTAAIPTSRVV